MKQSMKAMVLPAAGEPLALRDVPVPHCGADEVLVQVRAVGVGLTINIMLGTPGVVSSFPRIPGHEIAGDVVQVGSSVRAFQPGERVTCSFFLTCGLCRHCRNGRETLCPHFAGFIGTARDGGYAQYVALPARNVVRIPAGVDYVQAAVAADAVATAYHSCTAEARVQGGDDVLVIGAAGGVGIQTVKMAQALGARVLAADRGERKLAFLREQGADAVIDVAAGPLPQQVRAATGGVGVDAAIDIVGSKQTMEAGYASLGYGGRLVMVGFRPQGMFGEDWNFTFDGMMLNRGELEIHGSRYVNLAEIGQTLQMIAKGRVQPVISRTYPLEQVNEAHEALRRGETLGRLALVVE
jgi:D-arabinose 1-dehydrogenase-like Zn-dependent alcohol dehydrogenase